MAASPAGISIRQETSRDRDAIFRLTKIAFEPMSYSDGSEPDCINSLRADGDLALSLVAESTTGIVGHIAFSPATVGTDSKGWIGLGPVSVEPDLQKSGIGSALIRAGLEHFREHGALGCVLTGNPDYYSRFGFISENRLSYRDLAPKFVQWLAFSDEKPSGEVIFSPGLE